MAIFHYGTAVDIGTTGESTPVKLCIILVQLACDSRKSSNKIMGNPLKAKLMPLEEAATSAVTNSSASDRYPRGSEVSIG